MPGSPEANQAFSTAYVAEAIRLSRNNPPATKEEKIDWYNRCLAGHAFGLSLFKLSQKEES